VIPAHNAFGLAHWAVVFPTVLEQLMNFDTAISFLSHSNWGFLAVWLVLLAIAFTSSFPERTIPPQRQGPEARHQ
jgi:membrane-associated PAP2 superfamily phosphatase